MMIPVGASPGRKVELEREAGVFSVAEFLSLSEWEQMVQLVVVIYSASSGSFHNNNNPEVVVHREVLRNPDIEFRTSQRLYLIVR